MAYDSHHHARLGQHAVHLWVGSNMTDIIIRVGNQQFQAHKAVLTCYCPFFKKNLLVPGRDIIQGVDLHDIDPEAFEVLLTYMYTGRLLLTCHNLGEVYRASRLLQMREITHICSQILSGRIGGVISILYLYVTARKLGIQTAWQRAFSILASHLEQVLDAVEFLQLEAFHVREFLSCNTLGIRSEVLLFLALLRWLDHGYLSRETHTLELMGLIRFPLMSLTEVLACFHPPVLPGITEVPALRDLLLRSTCYVAAKIKRKERNFRRYECVPRTYLVAGTSPVWDSTQYDPYYRTLEDELRAAVIIQMAWRRHYQQKQDYLFCNKRLQAAKIIQRGFYRFLCRKRATRTFLQDEERSVCTSTSSMEPSSLVSLPLETPQVGSLLEPGEPALLALPATDTPDSVLLKYCPGWDEWKSLGGLPQPCNGFKAAVHNHHLYIIGGLGADGRASSSCHVCDLKTGSWTQLPPMAHSRIYHSVVVTPSSLLVVGGKDSSDRVLESIECLELGAAQSTWIEVDHGLDRPRMAFGALFHLGWLWVVGGVTSDCNSLLTLDSVDCFEPCSRRWVPSLPPLPEPLGFPTLGQSQGRLLAIGGLCPSSPGRYTSCDNCFLLDRVHNLWLRVASLPLPRHNLASASLGGVLYVVGGQTTHQSDTSSAIACCYEPCEDVWQSIPSPSCSATLAALVCLPPSNPPQPKLPPWH